MFECCLSTAIIPQGSCQPGVCLLVRRFQAHSLNQLRDRQICLALLFVVNTQIQADTWQSRLQFLGFTQGPRRLYIFSLRVVDQPQACISFRHIGAKTNDRQILLGGEVEVACILSLVSCGEVLRRSSVSILCPGGRLVKQGREGAQSGIPDDQEPMAATTHGLARERQKKKRGTACRVPLLYCHLYTTLHNGVGRL